MEIPEIDYVRFATCSCGRMVFESDHEHEHYECVCGHSFDRTVCLSCDELVTVDLLADSICPVCGERLDGN